MHKKEHKKGEKCEWHQNYIYTLEVDIDLSEDGNQYEGDQHEIGIGGSPFKGTFDGQGHTIKGLHVGNSDGKDDRKYHGLFGHTKGTTIKNVNLEDSNVYGGSYTGGLIGKMEKGSSLTNSENLNDLYGRKFIEAMSYLKLNTETTIAEIGGAVGHIDSDSKVDSCINTMDMHYEKDKGKLASSGGLIGLVKGKSTIQNSYVFSSAQEKDHGWSRVRTYGTLIGNADAANKSTVQYCYSSFYGIKEEDKKLVGTGWGDLDIPDEKTVQALPKDDKIRTAAFGTYEEGEGEQKKTKKMFTPPPFAEPNGQHGQEGERKSNWCYLPQLTKLVTDETDLNQFPTGVLGEMKKTTLIDSADKLIQLMNKKPGYDWDQDYILTQDIDLTDRAGDQHEIGTEDSPFTGSFDGSCFGKDGKKKQHVMKGLHIGDGYEQDQREYHGLFGCTQNAIIQGVQVEGASVYGGSCTDGLIGHMEGVV